MRALALVARSVPTRLVPIMGQHALPLAGASTKDAIPMATEILLPKIGFSMTEGTLAEWLVDDGATVTEGQPLFSIETDKSTNEVEAPSSGTLRITGQAGETFDVGAVIGTIE